MKKGFTLVELLVVIAVLSTAGLLVLTVFSSALKGSNKAQVLSSIKQNGQAVLETMDKTIRGADDVVCISPSGQTLIIVKDGRYSRYRFIPESSLNGQLQQDTPVKQIVQATGREETEKELIDRVCLESSALLSPHNLTDTNLQTGVSVINGNFSSISQAGFEDQVKIRFNLKPGLGAPTAISGQIDPVSFETTINLR